MVNLPIEYSEKQVTPYGGMSLMKRFIDQTGIRNFLGDLDLPTPGSNRGYSPEHIIESFWLSIWTGASRYIHCDWLRYDKVLQSILKVLTVVFLVSFHRSVTPRYFLSYSIGFLIRLEWIILL